MTSNKSEMTFIMAKKRVSTLVLPRSLNTDLASLYQIVLGVVVPDKCPNIFSSRRSIYKTAKKYNLNKNNLQEEAAKTYIRIVKMTLNEE